MSDCLYCGRLLGVCTLNTCKEARARQGLLNEMTRLHARLRAFATDCVLNGDMTPDAKRMLERILEGEA